MFSARPIRGKKIPSQRFQVQMKIQISLH